MKKNFRYFFGSFLVSIIIIVAIYGLMFVDLSTDKYMPGHFGPMFSITSYSNSEIIFSFMGKEHNILYEPIAEKTEYLSNIKNLIPVYLKFSYNIAHSVYDIFVLNYNK